MMKTEKESVEASLNPRLVAALDVFRATNDVRFYLQGIFVQPLENGGVFMCATNGHAMLVAIDREGYASRQFIMETNKPLITACTKKATRSDIFAQTERVEIVDGIIYAVQAYGYEDCSYSLDKTGSFERRLMNGAWAFNEIDGNYPDASRVFTRAKDASETSEDGPVGLNASYMAMFEKACKIIEPNNKRISPAIAIVTTGRSSMITVRPLYVTDKNIKLIGGIMPIHHDMKDGDFDFNDFMAK